MLDLFIRYRQLSSAERIRAISQMAADLFLRLHSRGGATSDELRQIADGLSSEWAARAAAAQARMAK